MSVEYLSPSGQSDHKIPVEEPVICILNKEKKEGVLKFIGETQFSTGVWCGVALREACGKNDGSVAGVRYFQCNEHHGIFVTPKNVFSTDHVLKAPETKLANMKDEESLPSDYEESRPRSKSDAVINEKKNSPTSVFNTSPFQCNRSNARSLSKLNDITYVCSSPVLSDTESKKFRDPKHSSPLASGLDSSQDDDEMNLISTLHHHNDLSPKFEVKHSIKLGSVTAQFPAPAGLGNDQDCKLNKTFLVSTEIPPVEGEPAGDKSSVIKPRSEVIETSDYNLQKQDSTALSFNRENPNESENERPRSVSKSSWSSVESLSSVGSLKSSKERSCGTKAPRKLPRPTDVSKSKLVKLSAGKKPKSKTASVETTSSNHEKQALELCASKPAAANGVLARKTRTKSSAVVAPRSRLVTLSASKSALKPKSGSVSTDFRDAPAERRSGLNASKLATPLATKLSAPPSSRLSSTPISRKYTLEKKSRSVRTSSIRCENESKSILREDSNIEESQNKSKASTSSVKNEREATKPACSKSRNLSASLVSNKPGKTRTLSTSAGPRIVAARTGNRSKSCTKDERKLPLNKAKNLSTCVGNEEQTPSCSKVGNISTCSTKEEQKIPLNKVRNFSTSKAEGRITRTYGLKSSIESTSVCTDNVSTCAKSLMQPRRAKVSEYLSLKERQNSEECVKKRSVKETTLESNEKCLSSSATPDLLKQTPEVVRHSVAVQADTVQQDELLGQLANEKRKASSLLASFIQRNREFEGCLVALQVYARKLDHEQENTSVIRRNLKFTKERYYSTENMLVRESNQRARLEEEMLSAKSDTVVEVALLRAQYERKQEIMQSKLKENHKKDLERVRKQNLKSMEDVRRSCELKLKRIEETYVEDISHLNEKYRDDIADLESKHAKLVDDLMEEHHAEIETIKADYDEQMERIQTHLSEAERKCRDLEEELRKTGEEAKRDIELRIQDAIAVYKSLPDELESTKFVLEMRTSEVKQLRKRNAELQNKIEELQRVEERAALLEREKESLNFVVENKSQFERKLCLERDKLRSTLNREVAVSKRLSLENEELAWRLNSIQNSPTSPTTNIERFNWRQSSGFTSPDSAVFSQKIGESDFEYDMSDTKGIES